MSVTVSLTVELKLNDVWTEVDAVDLVNVEGMKIAYGIRGNRPPDRVATTGTVTFSLRNDAGNSANTVGYYSPQSVTHRSGFGIGTWVRVSLKSGAHEHVKFLGKLTRILPAAGALGDRVSRCTASDWMDDAARFEIRNVAAQVDKSADELITAIVAAMPSDAQPAAMDLDAGIDSFPYSLDDLGDGPVFALSALQHLVLSELGWLTVQGTGTLRFENRQARSSTSSTAPELTAVGITGLVAPTDIDLFINHVRVITHPRTIDASAVVVWALEGTVYLNQGASATFWGDYRNPDDKETMIGAVDGVTPVATTDYTANTQADGGGADRTSNVSVTATYYASCVKVVVQNTDALVACYLTKCQTRAKGVYNLSPVSWEKQTTRDYGDNLLVLDMPYQNSATIGQGAADYIAALYASNPAQVDSVSFVANRNATLMDMMLDLEPGSEIRVTEANSGLTDVHLIIHSVEISISPEGVATCTWGVAAMMTMMAWQLEAAGSALGTNTILGYL